MAIKKAEATEDKNDSTSDKGSKGTDTSNKDSGKVDVTKNASETGESDPIVTEAGEINAGDISNTTKGRAEAASETSGGMTVTEAPATAEKKDTSVVGDGDVANTEPTKEKIAENKGGQIIGSAPTVEAPVREVTAEEAMLASSIGRPIPGVDLKPGDRPDIATTRPEHVKNVQGIESQRFGNRDYTQPLSRRVVGKIKDTTGLTVSGEPTGN